MMGDRKELQQELFYEFSLEDHVPADHLLRSIDQFVDLSEIRRELASFYSAIGRPSIDPELMIRMLLVDDAAFGASTAVVPKYFSPVDPAARWSAAGQGKAYFLYCTNYLVDLDHAIIVDVEATSPIRPAEVGASHLMIERTLDRFCLYPERLVGDTGLHVQSRIGCLSVPGG